jgi:tRNA(fMet)-specific endonuclease VapC
MRGNPRVYNRFLQYSGQLHISAVSLAELYAWVLRSQTSPKHRQAFIRLLQDVHVLGVGDSVARRFGEIRAWQLDQGALSPDLDLLNAAVALVHDLTQVSHNSQDYVNVPGLRLEDWLIP